MHTNRRIAAAAVVLALGITAVAAPLALAHEARTLGAYGIEVGFIDEPVFVGHKSGLEFGVTKGDQPVEGLEKTLKATVTVNGKSMDLPLTAREDQPGWYQSEFIPTLAGPYTFRITGTIESQAVDESFTSSPTGFDEVRTPPRVSSRSSSRPRPTWSRRRSRGLMPRRSCRSRSGSARPG